MDTLKTPRRRNPPRKAGIRSLEARRTAQRRLREEEKEEREDSIGHSDGDDGEGDDDDGADASDISWEVGSDSSFEGVDTVTGIDELLRDIVPERPSRGGTPKRGRLSRRENPSTTVDAKIQEKYLAFRKDDLFAKATSLADVGALSPEQLASRDAYIRLVSQ